MYLTTSFNSFNPNLNVSFSIWKLLNFSKISSLFPFILINSKTLLILFVDISKSSNSFLTFSSPIFSILSTTLNISTDLSCSFNSS